MQKEKVFFFSFPNGSTFGLYGLYCSAKAENVDLKQNLKDAADGNMKRRLAEAQLKSDYIELERTLKKIPPEIVFRYSGKTMNREENAID
jgi:hypothetical protein